MSYIQTVTGLVHVDEMQGFDAHTHLIAYATEEVLAKSEDLLLDSVDAICEDLNTFKSYGGNAIVEMTTVDYRYDLLKLKAISEKHGIHVIAAGGFNKDVYNRPHLIYYDVDSIAKKLIHEIHFGIVDGIKPGVLKIGTSLNEITSSEEKGLRAIARTHLATGVPIVTHTQAGTMALEQLKMFAEEKVPFENVVLCHLDQLEDFELHKSIVEKGVFLSYDSIVKPKYQTRERAIEYIVQFVKLGLHKQIVLGNDFARRSCYKGYGGTIGYQSLMHDFKCELRDRMLSEGISNEKILDVIQDLYIENPKRAFALRDINNKR